MIEEVGHADLETPQSEAYSHSGAIERLARETVAHLQFGVEPDDVSTKDAFNRIPVSNFYLAPVGLVIWNVDLAPESISRYRHRLETSIGTRTLCGCIRRMASVALARRSSPRKQWYWLVGGIMNKFSIQ